MHSTGCPAAAFWWASLDDGACPVVSWTTTFLWAMTSAYNGSMEVEGGGRRGVAAAELAVEHAVVEAGESDARDYGGFSYNPRFFSNRPFIWIVINNLDPSICI